MNRVKARVVREFPLEGVQYKCNQVIVADNETISELESRGLVCTNQKAVSYCLSKGVKPTEHGEAKAAESQKTTSKKARKASDDDGEIVPE